MVNKGSKFIAHLEKKFGLQKNSLSRRGFTSVFDVTALPREQFIRDHHDLLPHSDAAELYDRIMGYAQQVAFAYRQRRQVNVEAQSDPFSNEGPSYVRQFQPDWQAMAPGQAIDANISPAAYVASLYKLVLKHEKSAEQDKLNSLIKRRPDIPALIINDEAVNKVVSTLDIVNNILSSAIQSKLQKNVTDKVLASTFYPNSLPYHFAFEQAQQGMKACDTTLADTKLLADPAWPYFNLEGYSDEQVNTYTQGDQMVSDVAALEDGGWIIVWKSEGQDGSGWGIYQQRYDSSGMCVGPENRVNTYTGSDQIDPCVAGLEDGGWVVVWQSKGQAAAGWDVYQQRFGPDGSPVNKETLVNTHTAGDQNNAKIAALEDGGWVVVWQSKGQEGSTWNVYLQRFSKNGTVYGSETRVNTDLNSDHVNASITFIKGGGWCVVWTNKKYVVQQLFEASGDKKGPQTNVEYSSWTAENRANAVAALADGGWIVVYMNNYSGNKTMKVSRYNSLGSRLFQYSFARDLNKPSCTGLKDGGWVIAWSTGSVIYQKYFDSNGTVVGGTGVVNHNTTTKPSSVMLTGLGDGGWGVTWTATDRNGSEIFQQRFDCEGQSLYLHGRPLARSSEESDALRIGSMISPTLCETIEHPPYFSTVMYYVTGNDGESFPAGDNYLKGSVSELTPWYSLSEVAFITPPQIGVTDDPTNPTVVKSVSENNGWHTAISLHNSGVAKNVKVGAINYLCVWKPKKENQWYSLNNTYVNCKSNYADLILRVPAFGFDPSRNGDTMPPDGCVKFFVRMYDSKNKRYWTDISYTFASVHYQEGNIYTREQLSFYSTYFGTGAVIGACQYYASNFSAVDELTERVGLSVPELQNMLACKVGSDQVIVSPNIRVRNLVFVGAADVGPLTDQTTHEPYNYGAVYLHGGKKPVLHLSKESNGQLTLNELTDDRMDRMNRLIRLQRVLDIPFDQLDYLITAGMHAEGFLSDKADGNLGLYMNANTTRLLGVFNYYQRRYGVTAEQFAAITDQITPYAIAPGIPLLDRVFNRIKLFDQPYCVDWQPVVPAAVTERDARIMKQLAAGLGISDADMRFLASLMGEKFDNSLGNISSFYRVVMLSRWFGLDVVSFMQLVRILDEGFIGVPLQQHLITAPMIEHDGKLSANRRDWLDWLLLISVAADWLAQTGLSIGEIATPLDDASFPNSQGRLDLVQQLNQSVKPILVAPSQLLHIDLPQVDEQGAHLDWMVLLSSAPNPVIDAQGLVLDDPLTFMLDATQIDERVKAIVDEQKLSTDCKLKTRTTLNTVIQAAQQAQNDVLSVCVAQWLSVDQGLVLSFCRWANVTPYQFLAAVLVLAEQQAADDKELNWALNRFVHYTQVVGFYELSPLMLDVFVRNRRWFTNNTASSMLLSTHFSFASYRQWLHRTTLSEDDLLDVLATGSQDEFAKETSLSLLAKTLDWDTQSVKKALSYITNSPSDPVATMFRIAAVMRLQELCQQTDLVVDDLIKLETLELESHYEDWQQIGQAIVVGYRQSVAL
ncbi:Tc toxin subunit A [Serratia sp. OS31]|uniref:Tc toxin subunit A n=1 Tax=Serratia sp. OS31 TaxID=2760844 RepID=UPI0016041549|nr:Tc toxin subunit A [Serratia sp. OS31]MBB1584758.1 hypothetical protein [Serratia sp. OS31]